MGSGGGSGTTLWSQTFSSSSIHPSNIPSSQRSGWSPTGTSSYVCEGTYAYYSTAGSGNYFATSDFHVPQGKGVKITFDTKRSSSTSRITLYARVGGYATWSNLNRDYGGWMQLHNNVSVSTTCTSYEVTVPGDICGGHDLSICFTAEDNNVGIDNIQITDAGPSATVPIIASTSLTYNFNSSEDFYGPYAFANLSPSATSNIFSYRSYRPSSGDAYALINTSGGNGGEVNQSPVSGDYHAFVYKNSGEPTNKPAPSGLPCFITKELNTSTCTGTTATLRFAFFTTYSGYTNDEDYRSYCPRVYYATTTDGKSGYSWTQATVHYYFPNGKWWYASTNLPKAENLIVAFAAKSDGDDYTNIDDIKIVDNDCSIATKNGETISCTSDPGLTEYELNTEYTFTIANVTTGATNWKWIVRDLTTSGNPFYYGTSLGVTPAIVSGQGTQIATINFGTNTGKTYRVMCIPYDSDYGTDEAPTDACYAKISIYNDIKPVDIPAPVSLLNFEGSCLNGKILLSWSTATEINNDFFTLEKSSDFKYWELVDVIPGAGNSNKIINYSYSDLNSTNNIAYYRLKQTDYDGSYEYFAPVVVKCEDRFISSGISIYPNPTEDFVTIVSQMPIAAKLSLCDITGRLICEYQTDNLSIPYKIQLTEMMPGIYLLKSDCEGKIDSFKIVKK